MAKRRVKWENGDIFLVPLSDGSYGCGQVISREKGALNSVICIFFSKRFPDVQSYCSGAVSGADIISAAFVTPDLLDSGRWRIVEKSAAPSPGEFFQINQIRSNRYVGVKVIGSGVIKDFLRAYFGIFPWDGMFDPNYFDKLLLSSDKRPTNPWLQKSKG